MGFGLGFRVDPSFFALEQFPARVDLKAPSGFVGLKLVGSGFKALLDGALI